MSLDPARGAEAVDSHALNHEIHHRQDSVARSATEQGKETP